MKQGCPRRQQSQNMAKISKSYILTQPHPQGHVMSVKCGEPIDELTIQVWLLYYHPNFKCCTLFVSGTELQTGGQTERHTNGQTDDPITRCPGGPFSAFVNKNLIYNGACFRGLFLEKTPIYNVLSRKSDKNINIRKTADYWANHHMYAIPSI